MTDANPDVAAIKPAAQLVISDLETLKVLADPLRLSIIELLVKPSTVKRVANKIGKPPTKLYYHFNLLEKHGLINMVDTRIVSGIVEKHYQAAARSFQVSRDLLTPGSESFDENLDVVLSGIFADAREDLRTSLMDGTTVPGDEETPAAKQLRLQRTRVWLTPDQAETFYKQLNDLLETYSRSNDDAGTPEDPDANPYSVLMLLHPTSRSREDDLDDTTTATDE